MDYVWADRLAKQIEADGGFTVLLFEEGGKVAGYATVAEDGFAVGGAGPLKAAAYMPLTETTVAGCIEGYAARLLEARGPVGGLLLLGGWKDPEDGTVWIEPVSIHDSHMEALAVAKARGEQAYQDLRGGVTCYVGLGAASV